MSLCYPTPGHCDFDGQGLVINELMGSNTIVLDEDGDSSDWIEIYNSSSVAVNLKGFGLTDHPNELNKWFFPEYTMAPGEYMVVFTSDKDKTTSKPFHTNFKISDKDSTILLTNSSEQIIDRIDFQALPKNLSFGRRADGTYSYFSEVTPGKQNSDHPLAPVPQFSIKGGFYSGPVTVALTTQESDAQIFYTTDGRTPTPNSHRYSSPFVINQTTTIRAIATKPGHTISPPAGQTYFINFDRKNAPVLVVATEEENLWDPLTGIFPGEGDTPDLPPNLQLKQKRPMHVEYYLADGTQAFSQGGDIQVVGASSRMEWMRPFKITANEAIDPMHSKFEYPLLKKDIAAFRHLQVRNNNQDSLKMGDFDPLRKPTLGIRNSLMSDICRALGHFDFRDNSIPVVIMINGFNYGLGNFGEDRDNTMFSQNHPEVDADDVDLIIFRDNNYEPIMERNDNTMIMRDLFNRGIAEYEQISQSAELAGRTKGVDDLLTLISYMRSHNLNDPVHYDYVQRRFDLKSYLTGVTAQIVAGNVDFSTNNVGYWRNAPVGQTPGPFRMVIYDFDAVFGLTDSVQRVNTLDLIRRNDLFLDPLLANNRFREAFIRKVDELLNGPFRKDNVIPIIADYKAKLAPWIDYQLKLWATGLMKYSDWKNNVNHLIDFFNYREADMRKHVQELFGLSGSSQLTFSTTPPEGGTLYMQHITEAELSGTGRYFNGVPLHMIAKNKKGYRFDHFEIGPSIITDADYTFVPNGNLSIKVVFELDDTAPVADIVINEIVTGGSRKIFDEDTEEQDWIELFNTTSRAIDLSKYYLSDDEADLRKWQFPDSTMIEPANFKIIYASGKDRRVPGTNLHTNFKLSQEPIFLATPNGDIVDEITVAQVNAIENDHSGGKYPDGSNTFISFKKSTPLQPNFYEAPPSPGVITTPVPGATLSSSSVAFRWNPGNQVESYQLNIGRKFSIYTKKDSPDFIFTGQSTETSINVTDLPMDGSDFWARLWSKINGQWVAGDVITYHTEKAPALTTASSALTVTSSSSLVTATITPEAASTQTISNPTTLSSVVTQGIVSFVPVVTARASENSAPDPAASVTPAPVTTTQNISTIQAAVSRAATTTVNTPVTAEQEGPILTTDNDSVTDFYFSDIPEIVSIHVDEQLDTNIMNIVWQEGSFAHAYRLDISNDAATLEQRGEGEVFSQSFSPDIHSAQFELTEARNDSVYLRVWSLIDDVWMGSRIIQLKI